MSAVTEQFGPEAHVVMGAAIDEALQGRVEICVMGTTDVGGRNYARRPVAAPVSAERTAKTAQTTIPAVENKPTATVSGPAPKSRASRTVAQPGEKPQQEEFGFQGEPVENRGAFDKSDRNLFEGQDLDVPTYMRKGIKVAL
jgi:cell division protein FtsZ